MPSLARRRTSSRAAPSLALLGGALLVAACLPQAPPNAPEEVVLTRPAAGARPPRPRRSGDEKPTEPRVVAEAAAKRCVGTVMYGYAAQRQRLARAETEVADVYRAAACVERARPFPRPARLANLEEAMAKQAAAWRGALVPVIAGGDASHEACRSVRDRAALLVHAGAETSANRAEELAEEVARLEETLERDEAAVDAFESSLLAQRDAERAEFSAAWARAIGCR